MSGSNILKAPLTTAQGIGAQIARGELGGMEPFSAFGVLETAGAAVKKIVWPNGVFTLPDQTTGETVSFVSSNNEDGAGTQTGINSIELHYLDVNLEEQAAIITLTGTTPVVAAITGVRFIQEMHLNTVGSTLAAVGAITAYKEGSASTIYCEIGAGREVSESSLRMVKAGKRAVISGLAASSVSGTAAARVSVDFVASEYYGHQYTSPFVLVPQGTIGTQDNGLTFNLPVPAIYQPGTVIGFRATTDKGALISADWFGWLEDLGV